jgi:hypothetical protein
MTQCTALNEIRLHVTWDFSARLEVLTALTLKSGPLYTGYFGFCLMFGRYLLGLSFDPEDGSRMFLQNFENLVMG